MTKEQCLSVCHWALLCTDEISAMPRRISFSFRTWKEHSLHVYIEDVQGRIIFYFLFFFNGFSKIGDNWNKRDYRLWLVRTGSPLSLRPSMDFVFLWHKHIEQVLELCLGGLFWICSRFRTWRLMLVRLSIRF